MTVCACVNVCVLQSSLSVLNVSGNSLDSLQELAPLKKLLALFATDNKLSSMKVCSYSIRVHIFQWYYI